jgi:hypothetical protein
MAIITTINVIHAKADVYDVQSKPITALHAHPIMAMTISNL